MHDRAWHEDVGLPSPVDLPAGDRCSCPERDGVGGSDCAGGRVAPTLAAHDEQESKRRHAERQAGDYPPAEKRRDVRGAEQRDVAAGADGFGGLRHRRRGERRLRGVATCADRSISADPGQLRWPGFYEKLVPQRDLSSCSWIDRFNDLLARMG